MPDQGHDRPKKTYAPRVPPEVRREQLLDAAMRIVVDDGFPAATMEAVARAAEVAKPVLYGLFPSRDELLTALLQREEGRAWSQMAQVMPTTLAEDPAAQFSQTLEAFLTAVQEAPDVWTLLLMPPDVMPPEMRERYLHARGLIVLQGIDFTAWAAEEAGISDVDGELFAEYMVASAENMARLLLRDRDVWTVERLMTFASMTAEAVWTRLRSGGISA